MNNYFLDSRLEFFLREMDKKGYDSISFNQAIDNNGEKHTHIFYQKGDSFFRGDYIAEDDELLDYIIGSYSVSNANRFNSKKCCHFSYFDIDDVNHQFVMVFDVDNNGCISAKLVDECDNRLEINREHEGKVL